MAVELTSVWIATLISVRLWLLAPPICSHSLICSNLIAFRSKLSSRVHSLMPTTQWVLSITIFPILTQYMGASHMTSLSSYQMWWQKPTTNMITLRPQDPPVGISRMLSEERSWNRSPQILRHSRKIPLEWDRRFMNARTAARPSGKKVAWRYTRESTLVKSPLSVPIAEKASGPKAILLPTSEYTQERSPISAKSVGKALVSEAVWPSMRDSTLDRNPMSVPFAREASGIKVTLLFTEEFTVVKSPTDVTSVGKPSVRKVAWLFTSGYTQAWSPTPVPSVERASTPEGIVFCMAKSTQERHLTCAASVEKASLREGVWPCTSEAAHRGSPFDFLHRKFSVWIKRSLLYELRVQNPLQSHSLANGMEWMENLLRRPVLGRINWLFSFSPDKYEK